MSNPSNLFETEQMTHADSVPVRCLAMLSIRFKGLLLPSVLLAICLASGPALAGLGPENVAVIVNGDSWASKAVANEFIALHRISPLNVVYVRGLSDFEQIDVAAFRERLLSPALNQLVQRGLGGQIDCIVYSADLPHTVDIRSEMPKDAPPQTGGFASITGLTYLYSFLLTGSGQYAALSNNFYFRQIVPLKRTPSVRAEDQQAYEQTMKLLRDKEWAKAEEAVAPAAKRYPDHAGLHYLLACALAQQGRVDDALVALEGVVNGGWLNWRALQAADDLKPLHGDLRFAALLDKVKAVRVETQPTLAFRNVYGWRQDGSRVQPQKGVRYMLSTMLAVTSGRGNSVSEARACLRRSAEADASQPDGTFYFLQNDDTRSITRDWLYASAAEQIRATGLKALVIEGTLPKDKPDVAGLMAGVKSFDWQSANSRILPGAICEHFTSFSGMLKQDASQTPLTEFLRFGAAGASGTVTEPYLIFNKFPSPFLLTHYARGASLAEAFYQAVAGPYQLLIVGDPLCSPWARRPVVKVEGLPDDGPVRGKCSLRPSVADPEATPVAFYEVFFNGRRRGIVAPGQTADFETADLPDGYHEIRIVAVAAGALETRGLAILPLRVENHGHLLTVKPAADRRVRWDRPLVLEASLPGAEKIQFNHNVRPLGEIVGESGTVEIDPLILGLGPVRIGTAAVIGGEAPVTVLGPMIDVEIVPPPPRPGIPPPKGDTRRVPGLLLSRPGVEGTVVANTAAADWLKQAGVIGGQPFRIGASFEVSADEVCQFQIKGNCKPELIVDGETISRVEDDAWHFVPVSLAKGLHRLRIRSAGAVDTALDIRFGQRGARSIGAPAFFHFESEVK